MSPTTWTIVVLSWLVRDAASVTVGRHPVAIQERGTRTGACRGLTVCTRLCPGDVTCDGTGELIY